MWLCFALVFFGRLSPSRTPSPQPSPIQREGVALLFLAPLVKPSPECRRGAGSKRRGKGEADQDKGPGDLCPAERARQGRRAPGLQARARIAKRSKPRVQARYTDVPCLDPLSQARGRGQPRGVRPQTRGERFFGYFLVATRKYLAFGCENPIKITAGRRPNKVGSPKRARSCHGG